MNNLEIKRQEHNEEANEVLNRRHKDSTFRLVFGEKMIELANALFDTEYT